MNAAVRFAAQPKSPLPGVPYANWHRFMLALEVQGVRDVSDSGGLGAYDFRPRRLVELGYAKNLKVTRTKANRQVHSCEFVLPWTRLKFLTDPMAQIEALEKSILEYHRRVLSGELKRPDGCSVAGACAILHRGGTGTLEAFARGEELFEGTKALFDRAKGAF